MGPVNLVGRKQLIRSILDEYEFDVAGFYCPFILQRGHFHFIEWLFQNLISYDGMGADDHLNGTIHIYPKLCGCIWSCDTLFTTVHFWIRSRSNLLLSKCSFFNSNQNFEIILIFFSNISITLLSIVETYDLRFRIYHRCVWVMTTGLNTIRILVNKLALIKNGV